MQVRAQVDGGANNVRQQGPGDTVMTQYRPVPLATAGNGLLTGTMLLAGIITRSGPAAAYSDTLPDAAVLIAAAPNLGVGDSFDVFFQNTVAFAATLVAGVGVVLGANTGVAASAVRSYLVSILSGGVQSIAPGATVNATNSITGLTAPQVALIAPGMGVTGAGIPASTTVIGVNPTTGAVTLSAAATATTVAPVAFTFFPRYQIDGIFSATL